MLLNHSTTSFLFLIRLFFVRDVNEKNIYKYRFVFVKKIQKDIRNALTYILRIRVLEYSVLEYYLVSW